jgi:hypothetical protein
MGRGVELFSKREKIEVKTKSCLCLKQAKVGNMLKVTTGEESSLG